MKKKIIVFILLPATFLCLCSCTKKCDNSTFNIHFIDVGQGDSALVECDGHYMLIDGGDTSAGQKVYDVLEEKGIKKLDILAVSHLHEDHVGGLAKALTYASQIGITISNSVYSDTETFRKFEHELGINNCKITVPENGDTYNLGSARVQVVDVSAKEYNDSLVLLIIYGDTRFLFTGDIEINGQSRVSDALEKNQFNGLSLIKMPHHGAYNDDYGFDSSALNGLFWIYDPTYFIISVGENNQYKHPHQKTLDIIEDMVVRSKELEWNSHVYRTDKNGDIIVKSNGKELSIETSVPVT